MLWVGYGEDEVVVITLEQNICEIEINESLQSPKFA
jgi:hypothetical protein